MKNRKNTTSGLLYSTEFGRMCPHCSQPSQKCICIQKKQQAIDKGDGIVRVSRETKGRKGKGVTCITGIPLPLDSLKRLSTQLKQKCGSGGTLKNTTIEIQGDQRDIVMEELIKLGFKVKRSGG